MENEVLENINRNLEVIIGLLLGSSRCRRRKSSRSCFDA